MPDATVEISTLGTPMGSARMAGATIAVPPEPPAEMMPATPVCRLIQASNACAMAATDVPRSPVKRPAAPRGWLSATSMGGTSAPDGLPLVERSTRRVRRPASLRMSRMRRSSSPLVSSVPATTTKGSLPAVDCAEVPRCGRSATRRTAAELVRACASICATGTGCDQRVGSLGFDI